MSYVVADGQSNWLEGLILIGERGRYSQKHMLSHRTAYRSLRRGCSYLLVLPWFQLLQHPRGVLNLILHRTLIHPTHGPISSHSSLALLDRICHIRTSPHSHR